MEQLPLELAPERCQCLIIAALMLSEFEGFDLTDVTTLMRCIIRFLGHSRAPFANSSTVYCFQRVTTKRILALLCHDISLHPIYAPLESVLQ
jgi:hypothetical protein